LFIVLVSFIAFELVYNYEEISGLLVRVFSLYLGIYLVVKVLIYGYRITFGVSEMSYIDVKDLKEGDVVDRDYLVKIL